MCKRGEHRGEVWGMGGLRMTDERIVFCPRSDFEKQREYSNGS